MLCNKCSRDIKTTGAVVDCDTCKADGTAAGLRKYDFETPLASVLEENVGLQNRFTHVAAEKVTAPRAALETKKKPSAKKPKVAKPKPIEKLKRKLPPPIKKKKAKK